MPVDTMHQVRHTRGTEMVEERYPLPNIYWALPVCLAWYIA